jgi:hypothetical protein
VAAQLLLPPYDPSRPLSELLGGEFDLGDRAAVARGSGAPPFGARGTVVAVFDGAVELLMDEEFPGGAGLGRVLALGSCSFACLHGCGAGVRGRGRCPVPAGCFKEGAAQPPTADRSPPSLAGATTLNGRLRLPRGAALPMDQVGAPVALSAAPAQPLHARIACLSFAFVPCF